MSRKARYFLLKSGTQYVKATMSGMFELTPSKMNARAFVSEREATDWANKNAIDKASVKVVPLSA